MYYIADLIGFQLAHEYLLIHSECIRYAKYADKNGVLETESNTRLAEMV